MASDITLAVGDGSRRMTYAELADTTRDPAIRALEHAVEGLCEQRADLLQVKFEAGALAERIARDEAAGLRAELDARRQWGLRRRLRWALGRRRSITGRFQWVAVAVLGCIGLGDASSDDPRIVGPDAADRIHIEWRFTLPRSQITWPLAAPSSQPLLKRAGSSCQAAGGEDGG